MKKLKSKLQRLKRRQGEDVPAAAEAVPRITNETVAAHREAVLGSARKYIYPLHHSKDRIVAISTALFIAALVIFFSYCTLALYRFQHTSTFIYKVTQVIPFPVARTSGRFIAYENYLFEVRRYQHYYETQLQVDFNNAQYKEQLDQSKRRALDKVINDAYIKQLAQRHAISVSDREVEARITTARNQDRLGNNEQVFEDVLRDNWGWSLADFKRSLRQQLLAEKVVATLDKDTTKRAQQALDELVAGAKFEDVARKYSDDASSKDSGGEYGFAIDRTSRIPAQVTDALYNLDPGKVSGVINTGTSLEIVKNIATNNNKVRAAHIVFNFKPIDTYINDLKDQQNYKVYVTLPELVPQAEPSPADPQ